MYCFLLDLNTLARIKEIKKSLRLLFNRFSKTPKEYRKEYYEKNREKILKLSREWKLKNRGNNLMKKREYALTRKIKARKVIPLWQ